MAENQNNNVEFTSNKDQHLKRSLKARHMNMIALGGAIGTGLFVAGGEVVSTAGPGGALVAYGLIGIMVYFLMTSLGEMATYLPIPGSFGTYAKRYAPQRPTNALSLMLSTRANFGLPFLVKGIVKRLHTGMPLSEQINQIADNGTFFIFAPS